MAISVVSANVEIATENGNRLAWSLRPVFLSLQILGIDLNVWGPRSVIHRWFLFGLGVLLSGLVVLSNGLHFMTLKLNGLPTTVDLWCTLLQKSTRLVSSLLFQTSIYWMVYFKWTKLWDGIVEMGHHIRAGKSNKKKLSRVPVWILVTIISAEIVDKLVGGLFSIRLKKLKNGGFEAVEVVGIVLGELFECVLIIWFLSLIWLAAATIEQITQDVLSCQEVDDQVVKWRQNYWLISKFLTKVDEVFGPALIVLISKQFIFFVVYSYKICKQVAKNGPMVFSALYCTRNMFLLSMLIAGSQRVRNKTSALISSLNTFIFNDSTLQTDAYHLIDEIHQRTPVIAPMGVFELKPTIIPTCIGTTVTYLLVMASFASAQM